MLFPGAMEETKTLEGVELATTMPWVFAGAVYGVTVYVTGVVIDGTMCWIAEVPDEAQRSPARPGMREVAFVTRTDTRVGSDAVEDVAFAAVIT